METFKLVLPSNASYDHFPNNSSSHYCTYLHDPIQLEGKWEVAAESIYYSANIENENEKGYIDCIIRTEKTILINEIYSWPFKLSEKKKWLGYKGVELSIADATIRTFDFIDRLNANMLVTSQEKKPIFEFVRDEENKVTYRCLSPNFSLEIHPYISQALGFSKYKVTFTGIGPFTGERISNKILELDVHKRHIHFFHSELVMRRKRISLKFPGEKCDTAQLLVLWNKRVRPHINTILEFSHNNKVVLHHYTADHALVFSPEMAKSLHHLEPLIRHQTRWSYSVYHSTKKMESEHWYVDIYDEEMESTVISFIERVKFEFQPRLFSTVADMLTFLNEGVISMLKEKLQDEYNIEKHSFTLTTSAQRITLNLGSWLQMSCSPNIAQMLGLGYRHFSAGRSHIGTTTPITAYDRVQRVLLMTDIIESISYGNQRLRVLQDFVHTIKGTDIIEKRFQPLSFLPVLRNYIDTISIQLVNEDQQQITAKDVKTVVVLHFQRLK